VTQLCCTTEKPSFESVQEKQFLFSKIQNRFFGSFSLCSMGNGGSYPRVELLVCGAGHSRGNVKSVKSYSSTPPYAAIMA
jgi:hypothetical protein